MRLSGLAFVARWAAQEAMKFLDKYTEENEKITSDMSIRDLIGEVSRSLESNEGNRLRQNEDTEKWEGEWLYKDPE